ncbi:hypothetical protein DFH09DRAFT_1357309 [Mycena vulgaris]|nr:hypothetical protein DFH09DRAFT_1357309 [Mycena vulgaris]
MPLRLDLNSPRSCVYQRWLDSAPKLSLKDEPVKWNQEWERFLERPRPPGLAQFYLLSTPPDINELLLDCYRGSSRDLCRIQHQVSITAGNISAHLDFETKWLSWPTTERREFLQQAILRGVACQPKYFPAISPYCREVSIAFLEGSLLDVLKHCLLDDISEIPQTPIIYPNRRDGADPGPYVQFCSRPGQALSLFSGDKPVQNLPLKSNWKLKDASRDEKKAFKAMPAACEHCRKAEAAPKNQKMQVCAKCKIIGRNMPYCSRECVKADWPRHKIICGKLLTAESAAATAIPLDPSTSRGQAPSIIPAFTSILGRESRAWSIPPCIGGYKRSAALIRQVLLLQQNPPVDYFLCLPGTKDNLISISLPDDADCALFCVARDAAMSTGDLMSLGHIFSVLVRSVRGVVREGKYREEYLVAQMKKEYDVTVSSTG